MPRSHRPHATSLAHLSPPTTWPRQQRNSHDSSNIMVASARCRRHHWHTCHQPSYGNIGHKEHHTSATSNIM
jgi:hypothetical protein